MRKVVDFANVVATVILGIYLVLLAVFRSSSLMAFPDWLTSSGIIVVTFLVGLFLVGINIKTLSEEWKAGGLRRNLRITTDNGQNELSVAALEMLLLRDLKNQPDIVEPIVHLQPRDEGRPMLCQLELKLRRQNDVIHRIDAIKAHIRSIFDTMIPGGLTVEVQAEVRDFVEDAPRQRASVQGEGEFNGPVYTDDSESEGI